MPEWFGAWVTGWFGAWVVYDLMAWLLSGLIFRWLGGVLLLFFGRFVVWLVSGWVGCTVSATCSVYMQHKLPDYAQFAPCGVTLCLGARSLADFCPACRLTLAVGGAAFDVPSALCSCRVVAVARGPRWLCGRPLAAAGRRAMSLSRAKCQTAASAASCSGDIAASTFLSLLLKLQSAQTTSGSVSLPA